jgi:DNA-binding NarL/FixJ family response regulator
LREKEVSNEVIAPKYLGAMSDKAHANSTEIRVMLVDDHAFMRQTITLWLERESDTSVVAQAGSLSEAREALRDESLEMDIIVVDLDLPDGPGTELISDLQDVRPYTPTLVLTAHSDPALLARAIEAGAAGVIHKSSDIGEILSAIKRIHAGEQLLSQREIIEAVRLVGRERLEEREARAKLAKLTPREMEVLQALADGLGDIRHPRHGTRPYGQHSGEARSPLEATGARPRRALRCHKNRLAASLVF